MNNKWIQTLLFFLASASIAAQATLSNAASRYSSDLGLQDAQDAAATTCDLTRMTGSAGGNLGTPNALLCLLRNYSINKVGTATTQMDIGSSTIYVHYEMSAPGLTVDGVTYTHQMKIWTCGTSCTDVNNFLPAVFVTFTANKERTLNKGILVNNYGADSGTLKGTSFIKWDVGSSTENRQIVLNMVDCSSSPTTANYAVYTKNKTTNVVTHNSIMSQGSGVTRNAITMNLTSNVGNWESDTTSSAGGDSPAWGGGFTRVASGTDWAYSAASTDSSLTINPYTTVMTGTKIQDSSHQGVTCGSLTANGGVTALNDGTDVLTTPISANGGMTLHPTSL